MVDDAKQAYREAENKTKEELRKSDGDESLGDKAANVGDDIKEGLGNLGDEVDKQVDRAKYAGEHGEDPA